MTHTCESLYDWPGSADRDQEDTPVCWYMHVWK